MVTAAYAATVRTQVAILTTLQEQITTLQGHVEAHFGRHQPHHPPIRQEKDCARRNVHNNRLLDALGCQAQSALNASPGARAYYDQQRDRGVDHFAALRQLANRLVGILHGCLKTRTCSDEATAWPATTNEDQQVAA